LGSNIKYEIGAANESAVMKVIRTQPKLVDIRQAHEVIPGLRRKMFLHAGPPIGLKAVCGPHFGAMIGAILFEGLAETPEQAKRMIDNGEVQIKPANHYHAVAGSGQMISWSQPLFVVYDEFQRKYAYAHMREETFRALRHGVYDQNVIRKLHWLKDTIAPALRDALKSSGGIDLKTLISKSLTMGDECHNRCQASTALFGRNIMPLLFDADVESESIAEIAHLLEYDENWILYPIMAACKLSMEAGEGVKNSTMVTTMARNGVEFGIRVSSLKGRWFKAPAPIVRGLYFPSYTAKDACRDLGDSCITETAGLGGFAMAASPALTQFGAVNSVGGTIEEAVNYTKEMYHITLTKNNAYPIPYLDFIGTPTGINVLRVVETGIEPIINTSIIHREPGHSQVGAGLVRAPMECFNKALKALKDVIGI
jgi:hypothetical protein